MAEQGQDWSGEGFKPLTLEDRAVITGYLRQEEPAASDLNFTNLFMWRHYYLPVWRLYSDCLLIIYRPPDRPWFALPPAGPGDKGRAMTFLADQFRAAGLRPRLERAEADFVKSWVDNRSWEIKPDPDNSDYVYLTRELIDLPGRKFQKKRGHLNYFLGRWSFEWRFLDAELVEQALNMQEAWCQLRECDQDPGLANEDLAVSEALTHFGRLAYQGLVIIIEGRIEAFSLAEPLNRDMVLVHLEKANPEIRGLYVAVNQTFCREAWSGYQYINREQDLGLPGLRQAKRSWHPHHLVEKYTLLGL